MFRLVNDQLETRHLTDCHVVCSVPRYRNSRQLLLRARLALLFLRLR